MTKQVSVVEFKNVSRVYGDPANEESLVKALDGGRSCQ